MAALGRLRRARASFRSVHGEQIERGQRAIDQFVTIALSRRAATVCQLD
jgi:hypothetical protein